MRKNPPKQMIIPLRGIILYRKFLHFNPAVAKTLAYVLAFRRRARVPTGTYLNLCIPFKSV